MLKTLFKGNKKPDTPLHARTIVFEWGGQTHKKNLDKQK